MILVKKTIIVGAGASGLVASITARKRKEEVLVLERNTTCGKKLLVTGNGRCNYYNEDQSLSHYDSKNEELIKEIITKENLKKVEIFFKSIGIIPTIKNGYYYPYSNQAVSIQNALLLEAKMQGVEITTNIYVEDISYQNGKFIVKTEEKEYTADKVIIATGGKAASKTGSDGKGYSLAQNLGHTIIKPLPALVSLNTTGKFLKESSGIRSQVHLKLLEEEKVTREEEGEILLTNYGISGICVMQLSSKVSIGLDQGKKEEVIINFLPQIAKSRQEFFIFMEERNKLLPNRNITELLEGILNYKLVNALIKEAKIKNSKKWHQLSEREQSMIARNFIELRLLITSTNSFEKAQTTSGGIPLTEINTSTMESKKIKNLFFTGEILDVNGDCGGYNLTFAWITGLLAGEKND